MFVAILSHAEPNASRNQDHAVLKLSQTTLKEWSNSQEVV